jgi:hypothetical protein
MSRDTHPGPGEPVDPDWTCSVCSEPVVRTDEPIPEPDEYADFAERWDGALHATCGCPGGWRYGLSLFDAYDTFIGWIPVTPEGYST